MAGEGGESTACARTGTGSGSSRYASTPKRGKERVRVSANTCARGGRQRMTGHGALLSAAAADTRISSPNRDNLWQKIAAFIQRWDVML